MIRSFPTRFGQFGLLICEDVWHSSAPYLLAQDGAQVMIVLSNAPVRDVSSPAPGSQKSWDLMLRNNAVCHGSYMIYCNRVGTEDGVTFFGGSQVVDPFGEVEAQAELFTEDLMIVDLDLDKIRKARFQLPVLRDENLDLTIRELNRIRQKRTGGGS